MIEMSLTRTHSSANTGSVEDEPTPKMSDASDRAVIAAQNMRARLQERGDLSGRMRELEGQVNDMKRQSIQQSSGVDDHMDLVKLVGKLERRMAVMEKSSQELIGLCGALVTNHDKLAAAVESLDV
jgi:hypothetical protein